MASAEGGKQSKNEAINKWRAQCAVTYIGVETTHVREIPFSRFDAAGSQWRGLSHYFPPYFIIGLPEASIAALERWDHIHFAYLRNSLASGWGYCSFWGAKFGGYLSPAVYLPNAACSAGPPIFLFKSSPFGIYLLLCVKAKRQEVHQNLRRRAQGWHKENIRWDFLRLQLSVLAGFESKRHRCRFSCKGKTGGREVQL